MYILRVVISILFMASLSSCGTALQVYKSPIAAPGETTEIILTNTGESMITMYVYRDSITCSGAQVLEYPYGVFPNIPKTIIVRKGEPFTVGAFWGTGFTQGANGLSNLQCPMHFTFLPTKDKYTFSLHADTKGCNYQEVPASADLVMVPRTYNVPWSADGPWCKALSTSDLGALLQK